jgi:hypothetical protein
VARLHLHAIECQDTEAGFDIDDPWFFVDTKKAVSYLDSGVWLVDAGDYDNDGKSELIFSINREDEGGYEIWYDDFKKHTAFRFSYHSPSYCVPPGEIRGLEAVKKSNVLEKPTWCFEELCS